MSILRIAKFSLQDFIRNASLSIMTIVILILTLLSVNAILIIRVFTAESIRSVEEQIDVSIFLNPSAEDAEISELQSYLASFPEVTRQTFQSKEEVLETFKGLHDDNPDILSALQELGDNPLGPTLIVKTRDPKDYQKIIQALNVPEYARIIEAKTFADTETAIKRISLITTQVEKFSFALTVLFSAIAFIIVFNTIRVAIYTQKTEIGVKRLVGATSWFIRGPYIIESLLFSLVSAAAAATIVYFTARFIDPRAELIFGRPDILTGYFTAHILLIYGTQFLATFFLTFVSSSLAMRAYLKT